jgi:hypothetical protein
MPVVNFANPASPVLLATLVGGEVRDSTEERANPLEFGSRFRAEIKVHCAGKPTTIAFWVQKLMGLLEFAPLASAPLDGINKVLIASYVQKPR